MNSPYNARIIFASLLVIASFIFVAYSNKKKDIVYTEVQQRPPTAREVLAEWKTCMLTQLAQHHGNFNETWKQMPYTTEFCFPIIARRNYDIVQVKNYDEEKYHILPNTDSIKTVTLTLGVGHDVEAEKQLRVKLNNSVEMYGADPMTEINEELFSAIGRFFPFAVGANPGMSDAWVLGNTSYSKKTVVHIDFVYFLEHVVQKKFYDALWLDAEHAEYEMFPMFARGGALDQKGITFCQINLEIHHPPQYQLAHDFYFHIIEEGRYVIHTVRDVMHHRVYMSNQEDEKCLNRYKIL